MRTKIYINNTQIDVTDEISLSFTYNIVDVRTPENRQANYSKTITIPASKTNNELFTHIYDLGKTNISPLDTQLSSDFDPNLKTSVRVTVDEVVQFEGYCQLVKINRDGAIPLSYEVIMIGLLSNIFTDLGELELTDLDLSEYNHDYSRTNQANSWDTSIIKNGSPYVNFSGGDPTGEGYVYPLIDYGFGGFESGDIYTAHLMPAVYVKTYIDKIFEAAGYTYTSTFFDSAFFKKLIIPANKFKRQLNQDQLDNMRMYAGNDGGKNKGWATQKPVTTPYNVFGWISPDAIGYGDPNDHLYTAETIGLSNPLLGYPRYTASYYQAQIAGVYNIDIKCGPFYLDIIYNNPNGAATVTSTTGSYNLQFQLIYWDGVTENVIDTAAINYVPGALGLLPYTAGLGSVYLSYNNLTLAVGQRVYVKYRVSVDTTYIGTIDGVPSSDIPVIEEYSEITQAASTPSGTVLTDWSYFKVDAVDSVIGEDSSMLMNTLIPSGIKQRDFLGSIVRMFNLYLDIDRSDPKNYIIETRTVYYTLGTNKDWSKRIDYSKPIEVVPMGELEAIQYRYNYKADVDYYNKLYKDNNLEVYGNKIVNINNDFNKNVKNTDLIFSATPAVEYNITGIVAPAFVDFNEDGSLKQIDTNIRILYYAGLKSGDWYHWSATAGNSIARTDYPYANHIDDPVSPGVDLNWDIPNELYYTTTLYTQNNLYNRYHKKFIDEITDRDSKILIAYFNLRPLDIYQFNFYDKVFVDGHYFQVNKILDYNPLNEQTTKVELLRLKYYADFIQPTTDEGFRKGDKERPGFRYNILEGGLNEVRDLGATIPYTIAEGGLDEVRDLGATSIYNIVNGGSNTI